MINVGREGQVCLYHLISSLYHLAKSKYAQHIGSRSSYFLKLSKT